MNKLNKIVSENTLFVFFFFMIAPFVILFFYNHPSNDDWTQTYIANKLSFLDQQIYYYNEWSGRYFSNSLFSINPLYFQSFIGYKILTLFIMILFIYILYSLISVLTKNSLTKKEKVLITLSVLFLYLYSMPAVSQSFYWMTTAFVYQIGIILLMLFILLYTKITDSEKTSSVTFLTVLSLVTLILIEGCSEMSMISGIIIVSLMIFYKFISEKKINARLIIYILTIVVCVSVFLSAPGIKVRSTFYPDAHQLIPALVTTTKSLLTNLISWLFLSPLIFITFLALPALFKIVTDSGKKQNSIFKNPVYVSIGLLGILFMLFFAPVWSIGSVPFNRTINMIYFIFLCGWFYIITISVSYFRERFNFNLDRIPKYFYAISLIIVVLFLFKKNNIKNAYSDLIKSRAAIYNEELHNRYEQIYSTSSDTVKVPELTERPPTIFVDDITSDPEFKYNFMYAGCFDKKAIYTFPEDSVSKK
ncbi:MAG TPA: DUF6056 family protein [Ignavibacteria bacterium]|nr:DUF6056 family protein [Ignavibacteria bacterium]